MADLDEEFMENHVTILERFYILFDSIYRYADNLCQYVRDVSSGTFIQYTLDNILMDVNGKQLLCEALYLYGCMLLLLDMRIPGLAREKMIVAYSRHRGQASSLSSSTLTNFTQVCKLCRDTGYNHTSKRPSNYPDDYFARIQIDTDLVDMVLGKLRNDDIYNHSSAFPLPAHRSMALSQQASMLYVCMYFAPDHLINNYAMCREIVDKFFGDNWMVAMYMGFVVDLFDAWAPYKAASTALKTTLSREVTTRLVAMHKANAQKSLSELDQVLTKGVLTEDYVLDNQHRLIGLVRSMNFTLRWFILHRSTGQLKVREMVREALSANDVLKLILNIAQFEFELKTTITNVLNSKQSRFNELKRVSSDDMRLLSDYYSGQHPLARVKPNEKLKEWCAQVR